jgi:5-methylcytosine-specific restriction protein A
MSEKKKRLPWRCKNQQQAKDKATIYNSREWRELRIQKLRANPLCEICQQNGIVRSAHSVHHITPIETASTMEEMRRLAFCGLNGLMSLCDECHAKVHAEAKSHTKESVQQRARQRNDRWLDSIKGKEPPNPDPFT